MTMTNTKVRTQTKECTASNERSQLLRFRVLITTHKRYANRFDEIVFSGI